MRSNRVTRRIFASWNWLKLTCVMTARTVQLLIVGVGLYLIAKYMQLTLASVRWTDKLLEKSFFDVEGLTEEIRTCATYGAPRISALQCPVYRWLCNRLRKVVGLQ